MSLQHKIISELGVLPVINPETEVTSRVNFLADYLASTGLKGFVLGISGGQDSLLAGLLAQKAAEQCCSNGYPATFHAVLLPYGSQADQADVELAIATIRPDTVHDFNIKASVDSFVATFNTTEPTPLGDFNKGNAKARLRMMAQYAIAGEHDLLVIGTDHAAEAVTGFFTKYGDGGADITPLSGLNKRQGRQLLGYLGAPAIFANKPPTADLLDNKPGQTDETELGISYDMIDNYLEGQDIPADIAAKIEQRFRATAHKRTVPVNYAG